VIALFPFTLDPPHEARDRAALDVSCGGAIYGWVAWRTGSILWGGAAGMSTS
jgi:hypothetical protein